jgi:two-component system, OmpR family, sensor histidine kinase QseC
MNSLRGRLLWTIGGAFIALWVAVAAWMLVNLRGEMQTGLDERLAASARMVAGLASQFANEGAPASSPAGLLDVVARDGVACEVSLIRGELSIRKVARIGASPPMDDAATGYSTRMYGGKLWRTYVLEQGGIRVATADRIDVRDALLRDVALAAAVPFAVALGGSLLALWFGIGGGLAPLERMRTVLAGRRPGEDTPLPPMSVPREMRPLVDTIGSLLERVRNTLERERRFTSDAAHELRTPLTGVKTHLQVLDLALRQCRLDPVAAAALADANESVQRMQRTVEQLLLLARLDGDGPALGDDTSDPQVAAARAAREAEAACAQPGRVLVEASGTLPSVRIPETLLVSALRNLLDNALRIAPAQTPVLLRIEGREAQVRFSVLDEGPGMTEAECAIAPRRFWRASHASPGSGLGLAITSGIATHYGGGLSLAPRTPRGLCASIALPVAEAVEPAGDRAAASASAVLALHR